MRVLHVTHSIAQSYGGPTQSLIGYAAAAGLAGAEVTVAAPECPIADARRMEEHCRLHTFPSYGTAAFAVSPALVRWVRENAPNFDVVHVHGLLNTISSLSARAAIQRRRPTIIRPFGTLSRYTFRHRRSALKRAYFAGLERANLEKAAGLHFTTEVEREEAAWHGIPFGARAHVVPPPLLDAPPSIPRRARSGSPLVLFLSRLHPVKNVEALLNAWPTILAANPGARLVIAGRGPAPYDRELRARARETGAAASVEFAGFVTGADKTVLLARADVFVLPSLHENFGMAVLEALAAGVPAVVSPEVQLASFITANRLGVIAGNERDGLATAVNQVLADRSLADRAASYGRGIVVDAFAPEVIGERLMTMYDAARGFSDRASWKESSVQPS